MDIQVIKTKDLKSVPNIDVLVLGENKAGKTVFASTFPKPLFIMFDFEKGWDSLRGSNDAMIIQVKSGKRQDGTKYSHFEFLKEGLLTKGGFLYDNLAKIVDEKTGENALGIKTLVIDSLTSLWRACVYDTIGYYDELNNNSKDSDFSSNLSFAEREIVNGKVTSVINKLKFFAEQRNLNLVVTGHLTTSTVNGEEVNRLLVGSKDFPKSQLFPFFNYIVLIAVEGGNRVLYIDKTDRYPEVGVRTPQNVKIPSKIINVSYQGLIETLGFNK